MVTHWLSPAGVISLVYSWIGRESEAVPQVRLGVFSVSQDEFSFLLVLCIMHHLFSYAVTALWCQIIVRASQSHERERLTPNKFLLLRQFILFSSQPFPPEEEGRRTFFPGITDVGRLRGSLCFTIAALWAFLAGAKAGGEVGGCLYLHHSPISLRAQTWLSSAVDRPLFLLTV